MIGLVAFMIGAFFGSAVIMLLPVEEKDKSVYPIENWHNEVIPKHRKKV